MEYTATEIVQATGVPLRTIRLWTSRKLVPPPLGKGPGTRYTEEHRLLLRVVAQLRTEVHELKVIRKVIGKMSRAQMLRLIGEEPEEEEEDEEVAETPREQALPRPSSPPPPLPPAANARMETPERLGEAPLPEGARWVIVGLLPQLALMVGEGASPLVRRIAAEICKEYRQR